MASQVPFLYATDPDQSVTLSLLCNPAGESMPWVLRASLLKILLVAAVVDFGIALLNGETGARRGSVSCTVSSALNVNVYIHVYIYILMYVYTNMRLEASVGLH